MARDDYGDPDQTTEAGEPASPEPDPAPATTPGAGSGSVELGPDGELLPVVLPRKPLVPGQFGPGTIKGGKLKRLRNEKQFLEACSVSANITAACKRAGISRSRVYQVMASNPAFKARVHDHLELAIDRLEQCALHRAAIGVKEPVWYKGEIVGFIRKPSDRLAVKLLEGRRPEVYGRNAGEAGSPRMLPVVAMTRDQLLQGLAEPDKTTIDATEPLKKLKDSKP